MSRLIEWFCYGKSGHLTDTEYLARLLLAGAAGASLIIIPALVAQILIWMR